MSEKAEIPMITTWMGRDIRELTREELIKALEHSVRAYHQSIKSHLSAMETMRMINAARREE